MGQFSSGITPPPSFIPGISGAAVATDVELRFTPQGDGTLVELVHSGWEQHGEHAADLRAQYDSGWDFVFGERYGSAVR